MTDVDLPVVTCLHSCACVCASVTDVSKLVCGLHNRRLYEQAFTLVEILCQELRRNSPAALSMNAVSWSECFTLPGALLCRCGDGICSS